MLRSGARSGAIGMLLSGVTGIGLVGWNLVATAVSLKRLDLANIGSDSLRTERDKGCCWV